MYKILLTFFLILSTFVSLFGREKPSNWAVGPHLTISFPQSEFRDYTKTGEGLGAKILYKIKDFNYFVPRFDITYLSFGDKRESISGYYSPYYYIQYRNESFQFTMGPQFSKKIGRFTLYAAPMGGIYNFRTLVTVPDYYYEQIYGQPYTEVTSSMTKWGWGINGGLLLDIGLGPHLDLQFNYQNINDAVKTTIGDQIQKSDAKDISVSLGVVFFLKTKY